ncbi:nucleotidyltransferase family protein [Mesorhizobium sp. RP14(2022)]|uniref:Nucleotidyltransferase family protein n=1 Tax=Mesorhizobium liriopis TaxID=2953882 RepID=A0ABT1C269_9HYPH|nr:nucleotidyltransferase family protein [Mesorhizobium liriopis]MCO6048914.1 nucleotidyltransferase family protein [Mesorhizobium liriopis]
MTKQPIQNAMVLAAGLGTRMRPITEHTPKPLVEVAGKTLLDWGLDALEEAGIELAVVNVHHLAPKLVAHLARRESPRILVSDESEQLLDSAGGIVKALPVLGDKPFALLNADTFWIDGPSSSLQLLFGAWDPARMDILLLLADPNAATGHSGSTDFLVDDAGRLSRANNDPAGMIYAGAAVIHPRIFESAAPTPHSLNLYFDRAIAGERLYGQAMDGHWITVGTPDAIPLAEEAIRRVRGLEA